MIDTSCKRNKISLPPGVRRRWWTNWLLAMKWYQKIITFDVHRLIQYSVGRFGRPKGQFYWFLAWWNIICSTRDVYLRGHASKSGGSDTIFRWEPTDLLFPFYKSLLRHSPRFLPRESKGNDKMGVADWLEFFKKLRVFVGVKKRLFLYY